MVWIKKRRPVGRLPIPQQAPSLWTVPYPRNPFFTGRQELLTSLHDQLHQTPAVAVTQAQAICGLGGIGKTQVALEYTYRYCQEYHAIFWIKADTREGQEHPRTLVILNDLTLCQKKMKKRVSG